MDKGGLIKDVKSMLFGPGIDALPILALVLNVKIGLGCSIIVDPVECQERHVGFAHCVLSARVPRLPGPRWAILRFWRRLSMQ